MREIKFRAWDADAKRMIYFDRMQFRNEYNALEFNCDWDRYDFQYGDLSFDSDSLPSVMQFSGLRDKRAEEIYEGDFVISRGMLGVWKVVFNPPRFALECVSDTPPACSIVGMSKEYNKTLKGRVSSLPKTENEIIGNIYESPELLEASK